MGHVFAERLRFEKLPNRRLETSNSDLVGGLVANALSHPCAK